MPEKVSSAAFAAALRKLATRARRLAHETADGPDRSRLLEYAAELEERALRIETTPTSDGSH
jgi:hypothetical protein